MTDAELDKVERSANEGPNDEFGADEILALVAEVRRLRAEIARLEPMVLSPSQAVEDEREACAAMVESFAGQMDAYGQGGITVGGIMRLHELASAIRSRKQEER